jgi:RND family efflux transporter MFP subunit
MKVFVVAIILLFALAGCQEKIEPGASSSAEGPLLDLPLITLVESAEQTAEQFVGTVESSDRAELVARSSGKLTRLDVREGSQVKVGQVLLEISDNTSDEQLRAAEAGIKAAERQVESAQAQLTLAEQTAGRYAKLSASGAVTPQEFDRVTADLSMAQQQLAAAQAQVERGKAERDSISKQKGYNLFEAPFAGTVVKIQAELGATVLPGNPLLTIDREGARQARIKVAERLLGQVAPGDKMRISVPALERTLTGEVIRVQGTSDATSRSFDVLVDLPDDTDLPTGVFVRASRDLPGESLVLAPRTAISERGQLNGVYLVDDGIMRFRLVRLGRLFDEEVEILSGLNAGDTIVAAPGEQARNGARVE